MHTLDVGVIKDIEHKRIQVCISKSGDCEGCEYLRPDNCCHIGQHRYLLGACSEWGRSDHNSVVFKVVQQYG